MDRWLANELVGPLLFGIAAFTTVSLSVGVVFELVRKVAEAGLPVPAALEVLVLKLPSFLVLAFPMATLMATLLSYSSLSGNSELTALRSLGVSTRRLVLPALVVATLMSLLTFVFNDVVVPASNLQADLSLDRALGQAISSQRGDNVLYTRYGTVTTPEGGSGGGIAQIFFARSFVNEEMQDVTILDFSRLGTRQTLMAPRGRWNEKKSMWEFFDGRIISLSDDGSKTVTANFSRYLYPLDHGPIDVAQLPRDPAAMTVRQALNAEQLLRKSGDLKEVRRIQVRIQEKFAFPTICLVFGLIGSSLGVRPNSRTSRGQGFGISVLLIFGYYLMSFVFSSLGIKGTLLPIFAAWMPVLIGLTAGLWLLRSASR
ncbi:MAG: LptF/LptG family permease [Cyanobacteriota bacterium]